MSRPPINWKSTPQEFRVLLELAKRAAGVELIATGTDRPVGQWLMDFTACHLNGMPLQLDALLQARPEDFAHDAFGIARHLDRKTGKLGGCFVPRYAAPVEVPS